jgi:glutamate racemase
MGCTHFALISTFFQIFPKVLLIINPALATAQEVKEYLKKSNLLNQSKVGKKRIIVRGNSANLQKTIQNFSNLKKINIEAFPEKYSEKFSINTQGLFIPASTPT